MISTPTYYKVVSEIIADTLEIFDGPPYFHIGMDEESFLFSSGNAYCVYREDELWWHDIAFYAKCIEKGNCRPWMFSNPGKRDKRSFFANLPKSFLHSPWSYSQSFENQAEPVDSDHLTGNIFALMSDMGFDLAPCGSVWCGASLAKKGMSLNVKNYPNLALYCKKRVAQERLRGFFMVPWCPSTTGSDYKFMAACDLTDVARAMFEGRDSV